MSNKLLMNNIIGGDNMQVQKGTVTCSADTAQVVIENLQFSPDIFIIKLISDVTKSTHTIGGFWTPTISVAFRTDSEGITRGMTCNYNYTDQSVNVGNCNLKQTSDTTFKLESMGIYGPTRAGDIFEWTAIKYL